MTMTLWAVCAGLVDTNDDDTAWGLCVQDWWTLMAMTLHGVCVCRIGGH